MGLPKLIINAVAHYYANRSFQKDRTWNQEQDILNIYVQARKYHYHTTSCAGTFWFTPKNNNFYYLMSESNFPNAEKTKKPKV